MSAKKSKRANAPEEKTQTGLVLTLRDGKRYDVKAQDGKYYYVENGQFRKSNPMILSVKAR